MMRSEASVAWRFVFAFIAIIALTPRLAVAQTGGAQTGDAGAPSGDPSSSGAASGPNSPNNSAANGAPGSADPNGGDPGADPNDPRPRDPKTGKPRDKNPLELSEEVRAQLGSDSFDRYTAPVGENHTTKWFPYYEEHRGDYRLRLLPPFYLEHTRHTSKTADTSKEDRESLYGMLYYQRRSPKLKVDVLFPFFWRWHDDHENDVTVIGPFAHREAPGENDNWLAPFFFAGSRPDGGYFHSPLLLTTSHWGKDGAFTLVGPYFRTRTADQVDAGILPIYFHGSSGTVGARKSYTLVPALLTYARRNELDQTSLTVVGPVVSETTPKRSIVDVLPFFFHIEGKPETGGINESHTTVFPFFHYGHTETRSLFVTPLYLRRVGPKTDTMITPFFSRATTRKGRTEFIAAGPVLPIYYQYKDLDTKTSAHAVFPFFFQSSSPEHRDFLTPLFGTFNHVGVSRTTWVFPNMVFSQDRRGWSSDIYPLAFIGEHDDTSHTVLAPLYWDFNSPRSRTTVAFPFLFRVADKTEGTVTQVAGNTLYMTKRVSGGTDWQFHILPLLSFGGDPNGHFWNVLFGLAGYQREGSYARIKAFWIPITVSEPKSVAGR